VRRRIHFINSLKQIIRCESVGVLEGVRRHLGWQARRTVHGFPCELTISHSRLSVEQPGSVAALVNSMGMYDFHNMNLLKLVLSAGPAAFVDVGANIGSYTLVASEVTTASVFSIEPHPATFAMLLRNVNRNRRTNVTCLNVALSDCEGQVLFTDRAGSSVNRVLGSSENGETFLPVPCRTLDSACREFGIQPDIVKVDVEGHEGQVLAGFRQFLPRTKLVLIEGGEQPNTRSILNAVGFLGPVYFHFTRSAFLPFRQRRAEDPVYVNQRHLEEFKGMGIDVATQVSGKRGAHGSA